MSGFIERAQLLIGQGRYKLAEEALRQEIAVNPQNGMAHSLLALALARQEQWTPAIQEAEIGLSLNPDIAPGYYVLATIYQDQDKLEQAEAMMQEAIRIDPDEPDYFTVLSSIYFQKRKWQEALSYAEQGLALDSENVECTNLRAMALVKLGRKKEAGQTIDAALYKEPENALTHANQGWTLLERGQPNQAMTHFREALRLDPGLDWARQGIVEALKARNPIYRIILGYFFWMSRLSTKAQWAVIIGGYVFYRILRSMARNNPDLGPYLTPLIFLYIVFALLTWIAQPLFDLLLRLNRFGRLALSRQQITASNWLGGVILLALLLVGTGLITGNYLFIGAGAGAGAMTIPVAGIFKTRKNKGRRFLTGYTVFLAGIGTISFILFLTGSSTGANLLGIFILAWILYSWIANWIISR